MNGIGSKGAHRAPSGEGVQDVHADLAEAATRDASSADLHGTAATGVEPAAPASPLTAALLVVLTLGLIGATAACLAVVGLALAVWPPAMFAAAAGEALGAQAPLLIGALTAPLTVAWLLDLSWRAFAKARAGRCADYMLAALAGSFAVYAFLGL